MVCASARAQMSAAHPGRSHRWSLHCEGCADQRMDQQGAKEARIGWTARVVAASTFQLGTSECRWSGPEHARSPRLPVAHLGPRRRAAGTQTVRHRWCGRLTGRLERPIVGTWVNWCHSGTRCDNLIGDGPGRMVWRHAACGIAVGLGCSATVREPHRVTDGLTRSGKASISRDCNLAAGSVAFARPGFGEGLRRLSRRLCRHRYWHRTCTILGSFFNAHQPTRRGAKRAVASRWSTSPPWH